MDAAWARARTTGVPDGSIAALSGVLPEVVTLALDGWPPRRSRHSDEAAVISAYERWTAGEPLPAVARTLGITPTQLRRDLTRGSASLPRRLTATDIARRFGWNPSTAHRSHQAGLLPPPDGNEDSGAWWWEHTIEGWAAHRDMHPCPACEVIYPTSTGLRGHLTREHPGS
ncbi:helix-turn-helix domain-containing protein [Janibacter hoylei]